ncbi:MAG: hypothetical protein SVO26_07180 [Chloroflexota bacterium]|nr:hypothetical protein [Chloroflexota bacterium]
MMIRIFRLTDVAALPLFLRRSPNNIAKVRDKFSSSGSEKTSVLNLLSSCLAPRDQRHSYVCVHHGLIRGLACLRSSQRSTSWEIEHLLIATDHEECCLNLLERVGIASTATKAERLFLRLQKDSPVIQTAKEAGFNPYLTEFLYCLHKEQLTESFVTPLKLRASSNLDGHSLFRLYSSVVPIDVRKVEGMTFQEWHLGMDYSIASGYILEDAGEIKAWLRVRHAGGASQFDILAESEVNMAQLVESGLSMLSTKNVIYCLVPEFRPDLRHVLEERGFYLVDEFSCLSKQFAVRIHEPKLMPLQA